MSEYVVEINDKGTIAVDDLILIKDVECKAGSRMLEGFTPLFSAEVVERLQSKGYVISGKTQVGEFGLDLVGEFSHYGAQEGTLKGAAASLVAEGKVNAALAVDMTGAPRRSAALAGIDFLKPTYGTVSRYGIVSCAASGEQVGVYAGNAIGIKDVMEIIAGHDEKDGTSLKETTYDYSTDADVNGKKVAIVKELIELCDDDTKKEIATFTEKLNAAGVETEEISCDIFENANTAWQILMSAETCNNVSRYDGVKYGHRADDYKNIDELYVNSRTEGFNFLTKAVILYGSDMLSKGRYDECYGKALKVRRVIYDKLNELMKTYAAILTPACSKTTFEAYDIKDAFELVYKESIFTATANLTGAPALVSGGVQLLGKCFDEAVLLSLAAVTE